LSETSDHKGRVEFAYDSSADMYDDTVSRRMISASNILLRELKIPENPTVLDVGCGTGISTFEVMKRARGEGKFYGVDISGKMVEKAKRRAREEGYACCEFHQGDAERLDFPDSMFDLVVSNVAFHWFPNKLNALREMHRVLKPDGVVALNFNGEHHYQEAIAISLGLAGLFPDYPETTRCIEFLDTFPTLEETQDLFDDAGFVDTNIFAHHRVRYIDPSFFLTARDATTSFWQVGLPSELVESGKKAWMEEATKLCTGEGFRLTFYDIIAVGRKPESP